MAHSAENFTTLESILTRYDPQEVRYFLLATHYRSSLTFNIETEDGNARVRGIEDARGSLGRLRRALGPEPLDRAGPLQQSVVEKFTTAMDADFNTPDALSVIFDLAREVNTQRSAGAASLDTLRRTLVHLLDVLGLDLQAEASGDGPAVAPFVELLSDVRSRGALTSPAGSAAAIATVSSEPALEEIVEALLQTRREFRAARQWALSDEVRDRLNDLGVVVEDKAGGESTWRLER
jgi:cysteinyl-tRNA synthetase